MHTDHLGSTTFVTDQTQTGATFQKTRYCPWGQRGSAESRFPETLRLLPSVVR